MKFANRRRVIKHEAATILFRYPRRFFFSGCIAVFLTAGSNAVLSEICNALHSVLKKNSAAALELLFTFVFFMLTGPVAFGLLSFFADYTKGTDAALPDILKYYTSRKLFLFSLKNTVFAFVLFLVFMFVPSFFNIASEFALGFLPHVYAEEGLYRALIFTAAAVFCLLSAVLLCGCACFFRVAREKNTLSVISCVIKSFSLMRRHKAEFFLLNLSFLPLFALSYVMFGILFVFSLPYYFLSISTFVTYVMSEEKMPVFYSFV